ncbi:MAG: hypothetical protein AABW52_01810 [Nanoarchaeota archaeon]
MGKAEASAWIVRIKDNLPTGPSLLNDRKKFNQRCEALISMIKAAKSALGSEDGAGGPE